MTGFVEIAGGIAAGKTTLATSLAKEGFIPVFEAFDSNPFLRLFYAAPDRVAFETELSFMLLHAAQLQEASGGGELYAADFSHYLDAAYAETTLEGHRRKLALDVLQHVRQGLPKPAAVVLLECPADEELRRIRQRGRSFEAAIEAGYLERVNEALRHQILSDRTVPVIRIDSSRVDFREDAGAIAREIRGRLGTSPATGTE